MKSSRLAAGAVAGLLATVPMTLFMLLVQRCLPRHERHRLPPHQITAHFMRKTGIRHALNRKEEGALAWGLHFGFGATAGTLYAAAPSGVPLPAWLKGPLFGGLVWAGSYFGWLPSLEIHGQGHEQSPRRNALMLAAHLVWGLTLGALVSVLTSRPASPRAYRTDWGRSAERPAQAQFGKSHRHVVVR